MTPPKTRVQRVAPLAAAFAASDLTRIAYTDGDFSLELVRRTVPIAPPPAAVAAAAAATAQPVVANTTLVAIEHAREIVRAELVGLIRFSEPRPAVGQVFERDREVLAIESLGVRTPVLSGGKGRLAELYVTDGSPVEFGQPILVIERV
jgi:acetyl-CoA carboxylase biotin carboxyl carrier protein